MSLVAPDPAAVEFPPEVEAAVPRTRIPLAVKLTAYTALIVVITSAALSFSAYGTARETLRNRVRDRLEVVANDRRDMLLDYLEQQRQLANMVFKQMFFQNLLDKHLTESEEDFAAIGQRLRDGSQAIPPSFLELLIIDPKGTVVASTVSGVVGASFADRPEFLHGREDSFFLSTSDPDRVHLFLSTPMMGEDGHLLGVLLVLLDVHPLAETIEKSTGLGRTGQLLVARRVGDMAEYLEPVPGRRGRLVPLAEVPAMEKALDGHSGFLSGEYEGKRAYMVYLPVVLEPAEEGGPADWGLVAKIDAEEAFAPINEFSHNFFALQAGLIAAGSIASYAVARRLTRPIRQLTLQATRAAGGELSVRVPTSGLDELAVLATTFNSMIERLAESRDLLESRVVERTRELARTNAELAQEIVIRRAAEEALQVGQRRIQVILEATHEAFIGIDQGGTITDWNHQSEFTFGWSREEAAGRHLAQLILPVSAREPFDQGMQQFLRTGVGPMLNQRLEMIALKRDGREFPVEVTVSAVRSGGAYFFYSFLHDITQRKEAERLLRESEERFRLLVDGVKDHAILRLDLAGKVRSWNPGAERIHGYTAEEIIGKDFSCFYPPDQVAAGRPGQDLACAVAEGRCAEEGIRVRKDGEHYWASVVITALYNEKGEPRGFAMITRDVTQRRLAEDAVRRTAAELARSNAELEQFAYVASHDLQEPLRAVAGYCQLLKRRYAGRLDSDADEFIDFAVEGAARMQRLIEDLLCYSRVGTRGKPFEPTDMNAVFDQVLVNLKAAIAEQQALVTRADLPTLPGDHSQLEQLLQNLISNAIKFHKPDTTPKVHVAAQSDADHWLFSVQDNGIGIEPRYSDRIFAIFQRLHTRREYPGTGIGLAICKKIVERHEGRIWMSSTPGQGSTFWFTLPMKESENDE